MKFIETLIVLVFFTTFSTVALAQVTYAEKTEYSFEDDVVTGDLIRPDGEITTVRKKGKQRSLIKVRQHFIPEMLKSVEDI